jgi:hypothetical protein
MVEDQNAKLTFLGIFPKCPFYKSVVIIVLTIALITFGSIGTYFLNFWASLVYLVYSSVYYFLVMPVWHCQYCYYKVRDPSTEKKTNERLLPKSEWKESYLPKHVVCAKKWGYNFFIIWFVPIILIVISFFLNFSIYAVLSLFGFLIALGLMLFYTRKRVCTNCAIMEECHAVF